MPPKPKFTKEEIAETALRIIKEEGVGALTARSLGAALGTSARPIFTAYQNMDEVKNAARQIALREFEAYAGDFENYTPAFKRIGMLMVSYAVNEPEMFKLLFMQEHKENRSFDNTMQDLGGMVDICVNLIERDYKLSPDDAKTLYANTQTYLDDLKREANLYQPDEEARLDGALLRQSGAVVVLCVSDDTAAATAIVEGYLK